MEKERLRRENVANGEKVEKKPIVKLIPVEKYELVEDTLIHREYTPATALLSETVIVMDEELVNVELTLVTTLLGLVHDAEDMTKAEPSEVTLTRLVPATVTVGAVEETGMMDGESEETVRTLRVPTREYGNVVFHRTQS